ncbi:hypothetical protein NIES37_71090 (plasmid) [Tolypothrix tenuis PCC 7101]|uniref:Uncharacterized protein n=1 Tax=Tolypothrix tenuis PCC 7101 TaxID=231146 RepID=A0A1Z4NBN0_9CYAN|nr:hypothetical protein [Aulosira sp. FACHB-113]BAZ03096.1 hypothetical protein NIES37_71090 [Tolypothrix tenuis PCC 7101]BAZ78632.1 hypothetical protein NIES50_72650 [Aulosira laxa NIES-50]
MAIDVAILTKELVDFLAPIIPFLEETTKRVVAGEAIKRFGTTVWGQAQSLWTKLQPKMEAKPSLQEAVKDLAQDPADEDAQAALRHQLKKLLTEDAILAAEVARFWQEAKLVNVSVIASGNNSVATSGSVSGIINTGDNNTNVMGTK